MSLRIQKHFIAAVAATSIAVTSISAVPARAGNNDAAKALALILGLAVIGKVVSDQYDRRKGLPQIYTEQNPYYAPGYRAAPEAEQRRTVRPLPKRVSRKLLPQQCLRSFETDRAGRNCLGNAASNGTSIMLGTCLASASVGSGPIAAGVRVTRHNA